MFSPPHNIPGEQPKKKTLKDVLAMQHIPVNINESAWLSVSVNRQTLGMFVKYRDWDGLAEFWGKVARPAIMKAMRR